MCFVINLLIGQLFGHFLPCAFKDDFFILKTLLLSQLLLDFSIKVNVTGHSSKEMPEQFINIATILIYLYRKQFKIYKAYGEPVKKQKI